jgi:hypothetical protein
MAGVGSGSEMGRPLRRRGWRAADQGERDAGDSGSGGDQTGQRVGKSDAKHSVHDGSCLR